MATIDVLDATEQTVAIEKPNANGRAAAAASRPVALSTEDKAALDAVVDSQGTFGAVTAERGVIYDASGNAVDWSAAAQVEGLTANGAAGNPAPLVFGGRTGAGNTVTAAITAGGNLLVEPGATFNVSAAQTGAWTVSGTGTAGSAATGVLTIQGIASMTPVVIGGAVADNAVASGNPAPIGGTAASAMPTYTAGDRVEAQFSTRGAMYTALVEPTGGSFITATSNGGDAVTNNITCLNILSRGALYNGSTYDRARGIAGSFGAATGVAAVELAGTPSAHITTATTTTVKSGAGILHNISINTLSAGTITVYDNTTATGTVLAVINSGVEKTLEYNIAFATGLTIVTSSTPDLTIGYR